MDKHALANELRQRQYALGRVERHLIDALTDDEMIDTYITCAGCGERQVEGAALEQAIAAATNAEHFFALCDEAARRQFRRHHHPVPRRAPAKIKRSRERLN